MTETTNNVDHDLSGRNHHQRVKAAWHDFFLIFFYAGFLFLEFLGGTIKVPF
jgi:hypothetical protein